VTFMYTQLNVESPKDVGFDRISKMCRGIFRLLMFIYGWNYSRQKIRLVIVPKLIHSLLFCDYHLNFTFNRLRMGDFNVNES